MGASLLTPLVLIINYRKSEGGGHLDVIRALTLVICIFQPKFDKAIVAANS